MTMTDGLRPFVLDGGRIVATGADATLAGDLWHLAESRSGRRVPPFNTDREQTLASMDRVEALVAGVGARAVIQHELADVDALPRFPASLR